MKYFLTIIVSLFILKGVAQTDTLSFSNEIEAADRIFELLDSNIYGKSLLNRSFDADKIISDQIEGNYNQTLTTTNWLSIFNTISLSYTDHSEIPTIPKMAEKIYTYFGELDYEYDELVQPFVLILHNSSYVDTNLLISSNFISVDGSIKSLIDEQLLYQKTLVKGVSLLEFYPDNGYYEGNLVYNSQFIITSSDISILEIKINVNDGNGFQLFNESNNLISYDRTVDSIIAYAQVKYELDGEIRSDRMKFYLTTQSKLETNDNRSIFNDKWDFVENRDPIDNNGLKYKVAIKYGCGNNGKIRRPIIFSPPYRPKIQSFSLNKYWIQYNIGGVFDSYVALGYDFN